MRLWLVCGQRGVHYSPPPPPLSILLMVSSDYLPFNQYGPRGRTAVPEDVLLSIVAHKVTNFPQPRSPGSEPSRGL